MNTDGSNMDMKEVLKMFDGQMHPDKRQMGNLFM
jgi:hypothetical protein